MLWVFVGLAVVLVLVIALVTVGREAFTLGAQPRSALFDLDEAVDHVADRLPFEVSARLSYADVRTLVSWHLEYLHDRGVPDDPALVAASLPVVIDESDVAGHLLVRAEAEGLDVDDIDVVAVLDAETAYWREIGALGPPVDDAE